MSWDSAGPDDRYNTTVFTHACGKRLVGSARWYFAMKGYKGHVEMSNIWPPENSPARIRMAEFAIASAALLGAEFEHTVENGWFIINYRLAVGVGFVDQGEAATAYLAWRGCWVCYNKQADQWELAQV